MNKRNLCYSFAVALVLSFMVGPIQNRAQSQSTSSAPDSRPIAHYSTPCDARSNSVQCDAAEVSRTWGPVQQGVHVAFSLDKLTYAIGEDIPLHIAAEVVSFDRPVYGEPDVRRGAFFNEFSASFHLTIIGEDGVLVGNEEPANLSWPLGGSSGPSKCPSPLEPHKVYSLERSAKRLRLFPKDPGRYRMFVTWSPFPASDPPCADMRNDSPIKPDAPVTIKKPIRPFVTVKSMPLTIEITGEPLPERGGPDLGFYKGYGADLSVPDFPVYVGWRDHFRVADTPLGEATALEDLQSHLQWLRLTLTKEQTIESLRAQMEPDGRLAGWRFATQKEVLTLFANFTGSADGRSSDPGIERALQHLLGGPLDTSRNLETGWSRRDNLAVIAEMRPAKPEETPRNPAVVPGAPPPCAGCGSGFVTSTAYMGEDTIDGRIDASVNPVERGWYMDNQGVFWGSHSAILVVRNAPQQPSD